MIQYFQVKEQRFEPALARSEAFWIHLESPTADEIKALLDEFGLPEDFITDLQDADENSRMEYEENAVLVIMRVPLYYQHQAASLSFTTAPLGMIAVQDKLITVSFFDNEVLNVWLDGKHKPFRITQQSFMLQIALRASLYFLRFLKEINRRTNKIESELSQSLRNQELFRLLRLEKSLVYFSTSLRSNEIILERLQRSRWLNQDPEAEDLVEDVIIDNMQAIEMANIHSSILSGMMDAFASIISNNLNVVMKFLASMTIILAVPTLISSIYGMNVALPVQKSPAAFAIVMGIAVLVSLLLVFIFIRKKYF
ncbi:MAG: magnesium transporter CorA family protein [Candidatus Cloacimonetes bacterium]|nr:magnesium transporter CorA family protein [Candidatus Cloacimonadota bacterium]